MPRYLFLVDESGDAGIGKIRDESSGGASPYMTLGGALVPVESADSIREELEGLCSLMNKKMLHCKEMRHFQKLKFGKTVARLPVTLFGLVSFKSTLREYKDAISGDPSKFYNVCARYLLERLGEYMQENEIKSHEVQIIFEEANYDYEQLRNYISICQDRPLGKTSAQLRSVKFLNNISSRGMISKSKHEETLLQLSDLVAHAIYKCVDRSDGCYKITEPRYLYEISRKFYCDKDSKKIVGKGLKPVHQISHLKMDRATSIFLGSLLGE